jgi:hypothetical protein
MHRSLKSLCVSLGTLSQQSLVLCLTNRFVFIAGLYAIVGHLSVSPNHRSRSVGVILSLSRLLAVFAGDPWNHSSE